MRCIYEGKILSSTVYMALLSNHMRVIVACMIRTASVVLLDAELLPLGANFGGNLEQYTMDYLGRFCP